MNHYSDVYLFSRPTPEEYGAMPLKGKDLTSWENALSDYEICKSYVTDYKHYPMSRDEPDRQIRTHSCFSYCRNGDDPSFMGDDRPNCIELEPQFRDQLVCLYPEDSCETTSVSNPWVLGTLKTGKIEEKLLFAPWAGFFAMVLANPFQILWDFLCFYLQIVQVDKVNPKRSCALLAYQCFLASLFLFLLFYTMKLAIIVAISGDSFLVFVTFAFTFLIDQAKQFGTLGVIYLVVVRRFGFLKINEKDFINPEDREIKNENAIPRLKNCCLKTLTH